MSRFITFPKYIKHDSPTEDKIKKVDDLTEQIMEQHDNFSKKFLYAILLCAIISGILLLVYYFASAKNETLFTVTALVSTITGCMFIIWFGYRMKYYDKAYEIYNDKKTYWGAQNKNDCLASDCRYIYNEFYQTDALRLRETIPFSSLAD